MSNSNFSNNPGQENYRSRSNNERPNFRDRSGFLELLQELKVIVTQIDTEEVYFMIH